MFYRNFCFFFSIELNNQIITKDQNNLINQTFNKYMITLLI